MEKLLFKLQAQARSHPSNSILGRALSQLRYLLNIHADYPEVETRYGDLQKYLGMLAAEGLWTPSEDDEDAVGSSSHLKKTAQAAEDQALIGE